MADSPIVDVAVIGGGIHGVGIAQATAAAGYSVALLEKDDFAAGTSSKSSKLIHGGLRYLQQGQIALVRESLREREILLKLAPHLIHRSRFYIPVYKDSLYRPWQLRLGLGLYAALGLSNPFSAMRSLATASCRNLSGLRQEQLQAVFSYSDAQTDDRLLTRAVASSAQTLGAQLFTGAKLVLGKRTAEGYDISVQRAEGFRTVCCRVLVNAAGPWVNQIAASLVPEAPALEIELVQGSHLVLDTPLSDSCFYLESPDDQRAVFALPWRGKTLLGTTEAVFRGDPDLVSVTADEEAYLLSTLKHYFPDYSPQVSERMAGLRVLPAANEALFKRSREVQFVEEFSANSGYMAVYGGKLTGYRLTASKVVNKLEKILGKRKHKANTARLRLPDISD